MRKFYWSIAGDSGFLVHAANGEILGHYCSFVDALERIEELKTASCVQAAAPLPPSA